MVIRIGLLKELRVKTSLLHLRAAHLFGRGDAVVFDGHPFRLFEDGGNTHRDVGEHKKREGEDPFELFSRRRMDLIPFRQGRHKSEEEHEEVARGDEDPCL